MDQIRGGDVRLMRSEGSADVDLLFVLASQSALAQNQRSSHNSSALRSGLNLEAWEVGTLRLGPCTVGWALGRKPTLGKWRHSAWLPSGLVLVSPTSSEHACPTSGLLCGWLRVCGSCRERFAARRVREYVSSDVSLCTSYQS